MTRNPLAEPGLLGVSTGAALGAVLAIYFSITAISAVAGPLLGMVGALLACALTFGLGQGGGTIALVLAGAAAVLALVGKERVQEMGPPIPEQAIDNIKEDVQWVKEQASSGRR